MSDSLDLSDLTDKQAAFVRFTPKQFERFVAKFYLRKFAALRMILKHTPPPTPNPELQKEMRLRITDPSATDLQRAAAAAVLDALDPGWRETATVAERGWIAERSASDVRRWRKQVLARDDHACVRCGSAEQLHAHHVVPWVDAPELRVSVDNGETLCAPCHAAEHDNPGLLFAGLSHG